jgi:hypothetical protein
VPGLREISVGYEDACARSADGTVSCWGCNGTALLGTGAIDHGTATPTNVALPP